MRPYRYQLAVVLLGLVAIAGIRIARDDSLPSFLGGSGGASAASSSRGGDEDRDGGRGADRDAQRSDEDRPGEGSDEEGAEDGGSIALPGLETTVPERRDVRTTVLRAGDLPAGWTVLEGGQGATFEQLCADGPPLGPGAFLVAHAAFGRDDRNAVVASAVHSFDSQAQAESFVAAARAALDACRGRDLPSGGIRIGSPEPTELGDEAAGAALAGTDAAAGVQGQLVYVRKGAVVVVLVAASPEPSDLQAARRALQAVVDRA